MADMTFQWGDFVSLRAPVEFYRETMITKFNGKRDTANSSECGMATLGPGDIVEYISPQGFIHNTGIHMLCITRGPYRMYATVPDNFFEHPRRN